MSGTTTFPTPPPPTATDALQTYCLDNPWAPACDNVSSYYEYRPALAPNIIFLVLYAASLLGFAATWALTRRAGVFNAALMLGLVCEVVGYAGRVMSHDNPWADAGFMMQICCLTIGPAFMSAGCYLCLRRIVVAFGEEFSRLRAVYYTRIFIPCDILSLILQATGGALASVAAQDHSSPDDGSDIMIVGLAFQVFTGLAFIVAASDFAARVYRRRRRTTLSDDDAAAAGGPRPGSPFVHARAPLRFRLFLGALAVASVLILWRSCFRVAELSEGWSGPIMADEGMFIGFEGVLVLVAVVLLNVFHPAVFAPELFAGGGGEEACEKEGFEA